MFRHFLEALIRIAHARFPHEKGLEHQVRRLFKEKLEPQFGKVTSSDDAFGFVGDRECQDVLARSQSVLWELFKQQATGEGAYGLPLWAVVVEHDSEEPPACNMNGSKTSNLNLEHTSTEARASIHHTSVEECAGTDMGVDTEPRRQNLQSDVAEPLHSRRRGLGTQQRRVHVKARQDVTIRVKDLLRLLDRARLLEPIGETAPVASGPYDTVIPKKPLPADLDAPKDPALQGFAGVQELAGLPEFAGFKDALGEGFRPPKLTPQKTVDMFSDFVGKQSSNGGLGPIFRGPISAVRVQDSSSASEQGEAARDDKPDSYSVLPQVLTLDDENNASAEGVNDVEGQFASETEWALEEVLRCNFRLAMIEVLRLVTEVLWTESILNLRWNVRGDSSPQEELVSLLDYVETELTFFEFTRLLFRLTERQTQECDPGLCARVPIHRRLEAFLLHVFLPSMKAPYSPPVAEEEPVDPLDEDKQGSQGDEQAATTEPAADVLQTDSAEIAEQGVVEPDPCFWYGFEGETEQVLRAPRVWLDGFDEEVDTW